MDETKETSAADEREPNANQPGTSKAQAKPQRPVGGPGVTRPAAQFRRPPPVPMRHDGEYRPGRNDICWCGSGKKYKKCHMPRDEA